MQNQVNALKSQGIHANLINSAIKKSEKAEVLKDLSRMTPTTKLLYVTPEMLSMEHFLQKLSSLKSRGVLAAFVIDESHCISVWGHDWRPAYRKLSCLKSKFPSVPILACTATATQVTQDDILKNLDLKSPKIFISSFNRENIHYEVRYKDAINDVTKDIIGTINAYKGKDKCGIVYCHKRNDCDSLSAIFNENGIISSPYHAGLKDSDRKMILEKWISGEIQVTVATIAFGMGIDNPNVRFVIHNSIPQTLEDYYQESGRGGRDGKPARSILYYSREDRDLRYFLLNKEPNNAKKNIKEDVEKKKSIIRGFSSLVDYCESSNCRRQTILSYFGENIVPEMICKKTCDCCANPSLVKKLLEKAVKSVKKFIRSIPKKVSQMAPDWSDSHFDSGLDEYTKSNLLTDGPIDIGDEEAYLKSLEIEETKLEKRQSSKPQSLIGKMIKSDDYKSRVKAKRSAEEPQGFQSASSLLKQGAPSPKKLKLREVSFF